MTPAVVAAMCADYRASFHLDRDHDADDRDAGRRITAPVLVVTGAEETQLADAGDVWREWAADGDGHDRARRPLHPRGVTGRAPRPARALPERLGPVSSPARAVGAPAGRRG